MHDTEQPDPSEISDVEAAERAEASLDAFINSRSKAKARANEEEELWRASERRVIAKRRLANKREWIDYYGSMHRAHIVIAEGHARRRAELIAEGGYDPDQGPDGEAA
jgi:hypothetical protein